MIHLIGVFAPVVTVFCPWWSLAIVGVLTGLILKPSAGQVAWLTLECFLTSCLIAYGLDLQAHGLVALRVGGLLHTPGFALYAVSGLVQAWIFFFTALI